MKTVDEHPWVTGSFVSFMDTSVFRRLSASSHHDQPPTVTTQQCHNVTTDKFPCASLFPFYMMNCNFASSFGCAVHVCMCMYAINPPHPQYLNPQCETLVLTVSRSTTSSECHDRVQKGSYVLITRQRTTSEQECPFLLQDLLCTTVTTATANLIIHSQSLADTRENKCCN